MVHYPQQEKEILFFFGFLVIFFLTTGLVAPSGRSPKISEPIKTLVIVMKGRRDGRLAGLAGLFGLS